MANQIGDDFNVSASAAATGKTVGDDFNVAPVAAPVPLPPLQPTGFSAVARNGGAVLSWTASVPQGTPVTSYVITATSTTEKRTFTVVNPGATIALTNAVAWALSLYASSTAGASSAASSTVTPTSGSGALTGTPVPPIEMPVTDPTAAAQSNGSVSLSWPSVTGAASYTITATPLGSTGVTKTVTTTTSPVSVTGLTVGITYSFTVSGVFSGVVGPPGSAITPVDIAPSTPAPLTATINTSGNIALTWAPPLNTKVLTYTYTATPAVGSVITGTFSGDQTGYVILGAVPGKIYTITLTATSSLFTSAAATTSILVVSAGSSGGAGYGPVPLPGGVLPVQPIPSAVARSSTTVASNIAEAFILDLDDPTRTLYLLPHGGGLYVKTIDLGYPATRDVVSNTPDAHGTIDLTTLYGARGVTMDGAGIDYADASGVLRSSQEWVNLLRSWCVLSARMALVYRLRGDVRRYMLIRPQQVVDPIVLDLGRTVREWQVSFKVPDGLTYIYPDFPDQHDPVPIRELQAVPLSTAAVGGFSLNNTTGINLHDATGISFNGASTSAGWPMERPYLGTLPNQPIIRIVNHTERGTSHVLTSPVFTMTNKDGSTSSINLSGLVSSAALAIPAGSYVEIDVAARTVLMYDSANPTATPTNVRKYLDPSTALPWTTFQLTAKSASFKLTVIDTLTAAQQSNVYAELSYRTAFI